jgi:hypothetical protein
MIVTPTNAGSAIAGTTVGVFGWSAFLKSDTVPGLKLFMTTDRKERTLKWMNRNRGLALLGLEAINFSIHGITSSNEVLFALGNTLVNIVGLWIYLPLRQRRARRARTSAILQGMKIA